LIVGVSIYQLGSGSSWPTSRFEGDGYRQTDPPSLSMTNQARRLAQIPSNK
jgi:hypothetical protein